MGIASPGWAEQCCTNSHPEPTEAWTWVTTLTSPGTSQEQDFVTRITWPTVQGGHGEHSKRKASHIQLQGTWQGRFVGFSFLILNTEVGIYVCVLMAKISDWKDLWWWKEKQALGQACSLRRLQPSAPELLSLGYPLVAIVGLHGMGSAWLPLMRPGLILCAVGSLITRIWEKNITGYREDQGSHSQSCKLVEDFFKCLPLSTFSSLSLNK